MPTIQVREIPDDAYDTIRRRARAEGKSLQAYARADDRVRAPVLHHAPRLVDHRYGHTGAVAAAAWAMRHNLTFYDAIYAVLAAALEVPLLTTDARLAAASGLSCEVEKVGTGEVADQ